MVYVELRRDLKMSFVASALRPALAGQEQKLRQAAGTGRKGASHDMGVPDNGGKIWEWWSTIKFGGTLCSEKTTVIQRPSHPTSSDMNHLQGLILSIIRQGDLMAARERERDDEASTTHEDLILFPQVLLGFQDLGGSHLPVYVIV